MPRRCTICDHAHREAIDRALVGTDPVREIAQRFQVADRSLRRHKENHLPAALMKAEEAKAAVRSRDLMSELESLGERVRLLFDACDRWLRDADDPTRYDLGPRAEDVKVTYTEVDEEGRVVRRKAPLSELLARVEGIDVTVRLVELKHADPRELVLKASARLEAQLELIAKLMGELKSEATVNVLLNPETAQLVAALVRALEPFPEARFAVAPLLQRWDHGHRA